MILAVHLYCDKIALDETRLCTILIESQNKIQDHLKACSGRIFLACSSFSVQILIKPKHLTILQKLFNLTININFHVSSQIDAYILPYLVCNYRLEFKNQMQQFKSENRQATYSENLYHHYRQYVEFLNDFVITKPYTTMLIMLPNIVMIMDIAVHISNSKKGQPSDQQIQKFFHNIAYLGISQAIVEIFRESPVLKYIILAGMILFLLSPFFTTMQIFVVTSFQSNHRKQIGHFRRIYESSLLHKFTRIFIAMFQYVSMPVFTSVGIKLITTQEDFGGQAGVLIGTSILVLVPLVYLIGEYHLLEIIDENDRVQKQSLILARFNFPNNIFDCVLIYIYFILINRLQGLAPFLTAIALYIIRIGIAAYFKYYQPGVIKQQYFTLISSLVTIVGLFIAYLSRQIYIVMLCIVVLLILIANIKEKVSFNNSTQYEVVQNQQKTVEQLKRQLWKNGTFTHVFRELILQSRKNYNHRKQLLIEILKVKCYELESKSRGGAKMTNTQDLLRFQNLFVTFLGNMLLIGDNSISILRLLQNKDPKRQIFAHQVKHLVNRVNQNKEILARMRQINDISSEGILLMKVMFNQFYNDLEFIKDMEQKSRIHVTSLAQKQIKTRIFNKKTTAIFINIMDEPGKITRVSKNLPAVLGHSPSDLLGKSINEIIPFTIQPFHDDILIKFVERYSKKTMRSEPKIQFYAYNKDFHLQEVNIRYNFVMSYFSSFQLSGVARKIQEQNKHIILINEHGFLQGWTSQLATVFNFDQFEMGQCLKFNIMPLFPSLIKYAQIESSSTKTVFFRSGKVKQKALQISQFKNLVGQQLEEKQIKTFKQLLQNDELIEAYLADIQVQNLSFCNGKAKMKKIIIKNYQRIENFNEIQEYTIKTLNGQKNQDNDDGKLITKQASMQEYSVLGQQGPGSRFIDTNFTRDFANPNAFGKQQIRLQSQVSKSQLSIQITDGKHMQEDHIINDEINATVDQQGNNSLIEVSFSPKLQTQTNFIPLLIFIALCFIGIITWDQVVLSQTERLMKKECLNVINRNRALMIYTKSSFNPNSSYIRQFDNAKLMEISTFLGDQNFDYKTYLGDVISQNRFYMFNIQIPSTLDRILMAPNQTRKAQYQQQIEYNFNPIMEAWIQRFSDSKKQWSKTISQVKSDFTIRLVVISIGSIAFSFFLIYIYMQYRKQKKMTEAFFKFQNTDLDEKMAAIRKVIKNVQIKANQWHLDKEFYEFIKKRQITNLQFEMEGGPCETKIKFQTSEQAEEKLAKKKLYSVLFFIVIFLLTQILFIILYSVLNYEQVNSFSTIPQELNKACKLIVLPNLMLANMFYKVPSSMISEYKQIQTSVLEKPLDSVPELFNLLEDAPCVDCKFMFPLLTTNFRSFYSTFEQVINEKTINQDKNITDLYYAVDVVVKRVTQALVLKSLIFLPATVFLYIFSLTVFFLSIYFNIRKMIEENQKLEVFLKYFDEQTLVKNKHMNGLFNKNT